MKRPYTAEGYKKRKEFYFYFKTIHISYTEEITRSQFQVLWFFLTDRETYSLIAFGRNNKK